MPGRWPQSAKDVFRSAQIGARISLLMPGGGWSTEQNPSHMPILGLQILTTGYIIMLYDWLCTFRRSTVKQNIIDQCINIKLWENNFIFCTFHFYANALSPNSPRQKGGDALASSLYHTCMNIWVITVGGGGAKAVEDRRADVPPLHLQTRMDTDHEHRLFQKYAPLASLLSPFCICMRVPRRR